MLLPSCFYLSEGNFVIGANTANPTYEACNIKCFNCVDTAENCIAVGSNPKCAGNNRDDNSCDCNSGFFDNGAKLLDCEACPKDCLHCINSSTCIECDESKNLERNYFTGTCECKPGFRSFDGENCEKCYMLSDVCVEACP
jgi:hypothetical protein